MKYSYNLHTNWETVETVSFPNFPLTHDLSRGLLKNHITLKRFSHFKNVITTF